jgi:hypothetical protein
MGNHHATARSVVESERAAEHTRPEGEPEWARFIDHAQLSGDIAQAFRDLGRPEETTRFATISAAEAGRQNRARRGCLAQAALARAALDRHELDAAAAAGASAVRLAATVQSSQTTSAVADLRTRLADHAGSPLVAEFFDLADALVPSTGNSFARKRAKKRS